MPEPGSSQPESAGHMAQDRMPSRGEAGSSQPSGSGRTGGLLVSREALGEVVLATLAAIGCIPDGEHRSGCVIRDGSQTRERLRLAVTTLNKTAREIEETP